MKDLFATNWEFELSDGDTATRKDDGQELQVVFLAALQRLARTAGIVKQELEIKTPSNTMVQAIFSTTFLTANGLVTFVGAADCNTNNTSGRYLNFPTAVAESRAEARCLRKALGIKMLSSEEVGLREGVATLEASPSAKADGQILVAIEKLCENRGIELLQVIEEVITDKQRASTIFELSQLTTTEAQNALKWLNEQPVAKKQSPTTAEKRSARKAELESQLKDNQ